MGKNIACKLVNSSACARSPYYIYEFPRLDTVLFRHVHVKDKTEKMSYSCLASFVRQGI